MKKFALAGKPIAHSKSPDLFRTAYPNSDFKYLLIETTDLKYIEKLLRNKTLAGVNLTVPLKIEALQIVDEIDETAEMIGAANTIMMQANNKLKAWNTDYLGVLKTLQELKIDIKNQNCLIIGAGGAARAATFTLNMLEANITIANRTLDKAKQIAERKNCSLIFFDEINENILDKKLIINTISADICMLDEAKLQPQQIIFDAKVEQSVLLQKAQKYCRCIDGRMWLLHQGIAAYKLFTQKQPDIDGMRKILNIN